nr:HVA22-like protein i isoform X2 [Physcomitrium patens]|eukprot:XP_024376622.1 HVA22-like protein i isoform X2 [Physcomitrella patens]
MYNEAKLAFIIYLWYPKTLGTTYVYSSFLRPFVVKHESEIDHQLNELTTRAGDLAFFWWQRGSAYIQAQVYQILAYVASQSNRTQQGTVVRQVPPAARQASIFRPNAQIPRGPPRDPPQGDTQVHPPPVGRFPGHTPGGAGYPALNVEELHPPAALQAGTTLYPPVAGEAGPDLYPPPPGPNFTGSAHRRRGRGAGTESAALLSENSDSDYDVVEHSAENCPESRPESQLEKKSQQSHPSIGEEGVPLKVYNTRNRLRSGGSRSLSEWLPWLGSTPSGKDD